MLDEEVIVKNAQNGSERLLMFNAFLMAAIPAFLFGGNSELARGLFIALGILAPLNVINYKRIWIDASPNTVLFYFAVLAPYVAAFAITVVASTSPTLVPSEIGSKGYYLLDFRNVAVLSSASTTILSAITPELAMLAASACGLSIFFITNSRYVIRRIFFFTSAFAAILALFGFFYSGLQSIPHFVLPTLGKSSFSTFTSAEQWCAFATIWLGASLTIGAYTSQRFRLLTFSYSLRFISLAIAAVLLLSILYKGAPMHIVIALALTALGMAIICIDTVPTKENLARHWTSKYVHSKHRKLRLAIPSIVYGATSLAALCIGVFVATASWGNPDERLLADSGNSHAITLDERRAIYTDCRELLAAKPVFGWGTNSFLNVFSFKQGADLGAAPFRTPSSDLLQKLLENGWFGFGLTCITPLIFFLRWLWNRDFSKSGMVLFSTVAAVLVLGVFGCPFHSLAVLASFWILLMSAFKWDDSEVR